LRKVKDNNSRSANNTAANFGFEAKLWQAADALRNNMDAAEYKHVVLGLIFLKYHLKASAPQPTIGTIVDDAMSAIERDNPSLKGVLPKDFARPGLDKQRLRQRINLVSDIALGAPADRAKDTLGRVYEYFLSQFASAELLSAKDRKQLLKDLPLAPGWTHPLLRFIAADDESL
jgi:type I restriction enzyme M protein